MRWALRCAMQGGGFALLICLILPSQVNLPAGLAGFGRGQFPRVRAGKEVVIADHLGVLLFMLLFARASKEVVALGQRCASKGTGRQGETLEWLDGNTCLTLLVQYGLICFMRD